MGRLNTKIIRSLSEPGRYADGGGLYLFIRSGGSRQWIVRTTVRKKRVDIGLGSATVYSLAEAREKASELIKAVKSGRDPLEERRLAEGVPVFSEAAETVWNQKKASWKNAVHARGWIQTLRDHALPKIGHMKVDDIGSGEVLSLLEAIWLEKPETARRVKQRMKAVFDWAIVSGYRQTANPVEGVLQALPKQTDKTKHHAALPWKQLPEFMAKLRKREAVSARAL